MNQNEQNLILEIIDNKINNIDQILEFAKSGYKPEDHPIPYYEGRRVSYKEIRGIIQNLDCVV